MSASIVNALLAKLIFLALHIGNHGSFPPPLKPAMEKEYLDRMKQGDRDARNKLIEHNLRLVAHIMKKYYSASCDQEDLLSIGTIGLIKGINSFDSEKGTRLATYAAKCIDNEILMHFRNLKKSAQDVSMNEPIESDSEGNPLTLMDIIQVDDEIVEYLNLKIDVRRVRAFVDEIKNERDRQIIKMRYGMGTDRPRTQREVAESMNISRSYVYYTAYYKQKTKSDHSFFYSQQRTSTLQSPIIPSRNSNHGEATADCKSSKNETLLCCFI